MTSANFTVNALATPPDIAVAASSLVTLALTDLGFRTATWTIVGNHSSSAVNPTITPSGTPLGAIATFTMPSGGGQSYIIQAVVNNGRDDEGIRQSTHVKTALVGVIGTNGLLPFASGEELERDLVYGWTEALNASFAGGAGLGDIPTDRLLGRDALGTGPVEQLTVSGGVGFTGSGGIQTTAFTGDVTKAAGGTVLTLGANVVGNTNLRDSVGTSVIGRAAGTTGDPADIVASADGTFLGRVAGALIWTTVAASMPDIATDRLWGRDTVGTGPSEQIATTGGIEFDGAGAIRTTAFTGDVTKAAGGTVLTIAANAVTTTTIGNSQVTLPKLADIATARFLGRITAATGPVEELTGTQATTLLDTVTTALKGLAPASGGGTVNFFRADLTWAPFALAADSVTDTVLRDSVGLSVIGRSANTTGNPGDIVAANDFEVLRRSGTTIGFGTLTVSSFGNITTDRLLGRDTVGTGLVEQLTVGGGIEFTGGPGIQTSAFTGDVAKAAGGVALTIQPNVVLNTHLRDSSAVSVIGRSVNSAGDPADIAASANGHVLRRASDVVGFGTIETAGIGDSQVTLAKIANIATARILGRVTAATGAVEELTGTQATTLLDTFTSGLKGLSTASGGGTTNFQRADGTWAVPPGTTVPGGATTQLQYNNAGVFDGASGIAVLGTETALAFGAIPAANGLLRAANNVVILAARNVANDEDINIITTNSSDEIIVGEAANSSGILLRVAAAGLFSLQVAGVTEYAFSSTGVDFNLNNITEIGFAGFGATTAAQGTARGGTAFSLFGLTSSTDRSLLSWASDQLTLGQTTNAGTVLAGSNRTVSLGTTSLTIDNAPNVFDITIGTISTASESNTRAISLVGQQKTGNTSTLGGTSQVIGGTVTGAGGVHKGGYGVVRGGPATGASGTRTGGDVWVGPGTGATRNGNVWIGITDPESSPVNWQSMGNGLALEDRTAAPSAAITGASTLWSVSGVLNTRALNLNANILSGVSQLRGTFFDDEIDDGNSSTADTIDFSAGPFHKSSLTGNVTWTFTAPAQHKNVQHKITQDVTGGRTMVFPASVKWIGTASNTTPPVFKTNASETIVITYFWDGTNYWSSGG